MVSRNGIMRLATNRKTGRQFRMAASILLLKCAETYLLVSYFDGSMAETMQRTLLINISKSWTCWKLSTSIQIDKMEKILFLKINIMLNLHWVIAVCLLCLLQLCVCRFVVFQFQQELLLSRLSKMWYGWEHDGFLLTTEVGCKCFLTGLTSVTATNFILHQFLLTVTLSKYCQLFP